jgi:hypothetical protein
MYLRHVWGAVGDNCSLLYAEGLLSYSTLFGTVQTRDPIRKRRGGTIVYAQEYSLSWNVHSFLGFRTEHQVSWLWHIEFYISCASRSYWVRSRRLCMMNMAPTTAVCSLHLCDSRSYWVRSRRLCMMNMAPTTAVCSLHLMCFTQLLSEVKEAVYDEHSSQHSSLFQVKIPEYPLRRFALETITYSLFCTKVAKRPTSEVVS